MTASAAFDARFLAVLADAVNFTSWHYDARRALTRTPLRAVLAPGFFDAATDVEPGDMITISAIDGAATIYVLARTEGALICAPLAWTGVFPSRADDPTNARTPPQSQERAP